MSETAVGSRWDFSMSGDERRAEIMKSLAAVLRERNSASLTMQDVADRPGMTKGNLYHYFRSKQDLFYQCHLKGMADSLRLLDEARAAQGTASQRLEALMLGLVKSVADDPYGSIVVTTLEMLSEEQRAHYLSLRKRFERGVRDLVEEGVRTGEFQAADPSIASLALLGAVNWMATWYRADGARSPEEISALFADLFLRGLQARPAAASLTA
jgi:AcrR family transcriptional regulator